MIYQVMNIKAVGKCMSHSEHAGYNRNGEAGRIDENRKSDCDSIFRKFERLYI